MYRILDLADKRDNYASLYKYMTKTNEVNQVVPVEFATDAELDTFVEDLLNNKGYAKSDFMIITVKDYGVSADIA